MDRFLIELRAEGAWEGEGNFTLLLERMVEKMRRYQSDEPALYFLKAVQAAVSLSARAVDIRLGRGTVEVIFEPRLDLELSLDTLLTAQCQGLAAEHMATMLLAVLATDPPEARLEWCCGEVWQQWSVSQGVSTFSSKPAKASRKAFRLFLKRRAVGLLERIIPSTALLQIQSTLGQRCAFCPIPVKFDGRLVNRPAPESFAPFRATLPLLAQLGKKTPWGIEKIWVRSQIPHFRLAGYWSRRAGRIQVGSRQYPMVCSQFEGPHACKTSVLEGLESEWKIVERTTVSEWDQPHFLGYQSEDPSLRGSALVLWRQQSRGFDPEKDSDIDDLEPDPDGFAAERWLALCLNSRADGVLVYVKAGIALDPVHYESVEPGSSCLWARDDAPTDLGQLRVRGDDQIVRADLDWLAEQQTVLLAEYGDPKRQGQEPKTFSPDFVVLWNREYHLELKGKSLVLGKASSLFEVRTLFTDLVSLKVDHSGQALVVESGPRSSKPLHPLVALSDLTVVSLEWVEYLHERDWPAEDEPALQVRLELRAGDQFLRFTGGGYVKQRLGYDYQVLSRWCEWLASISNAQFEARTGKDRLW